jgi:hypothetical protein
MSKALRVPEYLEHILSAIKRIERHVTDVDEFGFLQSELLQDAVVRNIEVWLSVNSQVPGSSPGRGANHTNARRRKFVGFFNSRFSRQALASSLRR